MFNEKNFLSEEKIMSGCKFPFLVNPQTSKVVMSS